MAPNAAARRRGAARLGARLPIYGADSGPGCRGDWFLVGPTAWICADRVVVSKEAPTPDAESPDAPDGLPARYYFVGEEGAFAYRSPTDAEETAPAAELQKGFAVSVVGTDTGPRAEPFAHTSKGLWLAMRDLAPVRPLIFHGYEARDGKLDRGWVVVDAAAVYDEPGGRKVTAGAPRRFDGVAILERREVKGKRWARIAEAAWMAESDLRIPEPSAPPDEAAPAERWLDVDLANQVVTAYEGKRAVYATLASTGVGRDRDPTATPLGVHRVWVKLLTSDMTNLEDEEALRYYAIQDVPWVLFFDKGFGFHGAFWHRSFGHVRSHGCVNLTPLDAEWLFHWSSPHLPAGWSAALPTDYDPGTLVRVR
jgi:hypothetical protein